MHAGQDILWYFTGLPHWDFNGIFRARFRPDTVDSDIKGTFDLFASRGVPISWRTGPATTPTNLGEHLQSHGLQYVGDARGMAMELSLLRQNMIMPPGLSVECATSASARQDFMRVYAAGSDDSEGYVGTFGKVFKILRSGERPGWRHYVGYMNGSPVACSCVYLGSQLAGIFRVAVIPEVRGEGIGSAISMAPLLTARELGYRVAVLNPSDMSYGMYKRLGFQERYRMSLYVWEQR